MKIKRMRGGGMTSKPSTGPSSSLNAPARTASSSRVSGIGAKASSAASKAQTASKSSASKPSASASVSRAATASRSGASQASKAAGSKSSGGSSGGNFGSQPAGTKPASVSKSVASNGSIRSSNPMASQGPSFKTPTAAKKANDAYVKTYGFANRVNKAFPSAMGDIEDIRRTMGPFNARDRRYDDGWMGRFDPNNPFTREQYRKWQAGEDARRMAEEVRFDKLRERRARPIGRPDTRSPGERMADIRSQKLAYEKARGDSANYSMQKRVAAERQAVLQQLNRDRLENTDPRVAKIRRDSSSKIPNAPVGTGRAMSIMGGLAKGGLVKKKKK